MGIIVKSSWEIELMRRAGLITAKVLDALRQEVKPGVTTRKLDIIAARMVKELGGKAAFKGYRGYPASICASINEEVVHGIPSDRVLEEGDIVGIDFAAICDGFHGDAAITVGVGVTGQEARVLVEATQGALMAGIAAAKEGMHLGDVSAAVDKHARSYGFSTVREYVGHGIGRSMHEEPQVPNFGLAGRGPVLKRGMTLAIEPMVNVGGWRTKVLPDTWTVVTTDASLSGHFEHTVLITDGDAEILTSL